MRGTVLALAVGRYVIAGVNDAENHRKEHPPCHRRFPPTPAAKSTFRTGSKKPFLRAIHNMLFVSNGQYNWQLDLFCRKLKLVELCQKSVEFIRKYDLIEFPCFPYFSLTKQYGKICTDAFRRRISHCVTECHRMGVHSLCSWLDPSLMQRGLGEQRGGISSLNGGRLQSSNKVKLIHLGMRPAAPKRISPQHPKTAMWWR